MWSKMLAKCFYLIFIACVSCINRSNQFPETGCGSFEAVSHVAFDVDDRIRDANTHSKLLEIGGVASLHNSDKDLGPRTHLCGGILISRNFLLTAAHCMVRNGTERITTINLGRENLEENASPGPNTYKVDKVFYPTNFVSIPNDYDDIALIKTDRPVIYSKEIWPLCLPESNEIFPDYFRVDISGWGQVDQLAISSPSLQIASIKIVENSRCEDLWRIHARNTYDHKIRKFEYPDGLTKQVLCAGDRGIDACKGDSGGPMSYQDSEGHHIAIGIIAKGINCPLQPIVPGFYTNIGNYVDWIYDTTWLPRRTKSTTSSTQQTSPSSFIAVPVNDPCLSNPCGLNAKCSSRGKIFHCSCLNGYEGNPLVSCIQNDPCQPNPCGLNAKCQVHGRNSHCNCPIGYEGNPLTTCTRTIIGFTVPPLVASTTPKSFPVSLPTFVPARLLALPDPQLCSNRPKQWRHANHNYFFSWDQPELGLENDPITGESKGKKVDWLEGRNQCRMRCMDLVGMETEAENNMIFDFIRTRNITYIWTSGRLCDFEICSTRPDVHPINVFGWFWSNTNTHLAPTNSTPPGWAEQPWSQLGHAGGPQPDNAEYDLNQTSESCMGIFNGIYGTLVKWHDVACYHKKPFICEDNDLLLQYVQQTNPNIQL